ncbi:hypothetical protein ABI59_06105 [Acidobacteria bacterium Mor1]|nr:hypothetical protein ABI59_06105 [Acidobacteria bacterium Mor1]
MTSVTSETTFVLARRGDGFEIAADQTPRFRADREGDGWTVTDLASSDRSPLRRAGEWRGMQWRPAAEATACSSGSAERSEREAAWFLATRDGRQFRVLRRGADSGREVLGWETAGAYFHVANRDGVWHVRPTVAGAALGELEVLDDILVLLAAELTL